MSASNDDGGSVAVAPCGGSPEKVLPPADDAEAPPKQGGMSGRSERLPLVRSPDGYSVPLMTTLLLMGAYVAYGMTVGIIGPTILDLAILLNRTLSDASFLVMMRPLGTSTGAILSPPLCSRMNPFIFLFGVNFLTGLALVATPFSRNIYLTSLFLGLAGLGTGFLSTGSNIYMLDMWGDGALPWLQATYGLLGVGALVAPLIAAPFLLDQPTEDSESQASPEVLNLNLTSQVTAAAGEIAGSGETQVHIAYIIIGTFTLATSFTFLVQWIFVRSYKFIGRVAHKDSSKERRVDDESGFSPEVECNRKLLKTVIVAMACFFFFVLVYSEVGYADLVVPFGVYSDLKLSKARAAAINSFYWGAYTAARLASALMAIKTGPMKLLLGSFVVGTVGTLLLLVLANSSEVWLWVGSGLLALGRAAIYASGVALLEKYIKITPLIFGLFVVFSAGGEAIVSWVVARNLEKRPMDMMIAETVANFVMIVVFAALLYLLRVYRRRYHRNGDGDGDGGGGPSRTASPMPLQQPSAARTESTGS